jgi:hypothetical protein
VCANNGKRFLDPATLSDHILNDEHAFAEGDFEAAPEDKLALFFFGEDEAALQLAGDFLADDEAAHGWSDDGLDILGANFFGKRSSKPFHIGHLLEGNGALEILAAVQTGAQDEVTFKEGSGGFK